MRVTRSETIRLKCLYCCRGKADEVKRCSSRNCPLWKYRTGYEVDDEENYTPQKERQ